MQKILASIILIIIPSSLLFADTFTIGDQQVEIPDPNGFVRVTEDMRMVAGVVNQMSDPMNDLLAYYIMESEVPAARAGELPPLERTCMVKVNKELRNYKLTRSDFAELKAMMKEENKTIFESIQAQIPEQMNQISTGVSDEFNIDFAVKVSQMVPLDVHAETIDSMAYSMYINYGINAGSEEIENVVAATATILNASGSLLFLYSYAPKEQLEWTRSSSGVWAESIVSQNSAPPEKSPAGIKINWRKVLEKTIIGAVIGGVLALLSVIFKKKNK